MLRNQCHIGVYELHLTFEGPMQLSYNVLVSGISKIQLVCDIFFNFVLL